MGEFGDIWFKPLWQMTAAERVRVMQIWRQGSAAMPSQEWIDTEHARVALERERLEREAIEGAAS